MYIAFWVVHCLSIASLAGLALRNVYKRGKAETRVGELEREARRLRCANEMMWDDMIALRTRRRLPRGGCDAEA